MGMKSEKVLEVVGIYRRFFEENGIGKIDYPHDDILHDAKLGLEHCHGMLDKMEEFVHEGRMEKAFRWLGFVQGVLWACGYYPIANLMDHNRPETKEE